MKLKLCILASLCVLCLAASQAEERNGHRLEVGGSAGVALYGDVVGYDATLELRRYGTKPLGAVLPFVGAGAFGQYTNGDSHSMWNAYGFALAGGDWVILPRLPMLTLRTQIAVGGGWTSDSNSAGHVAGNFGLLVHPAAGIEYALGNGRLNLMVGYELLYVDSTALTATDVRVGISRSL